MIVSFFLAVLNWILDTLFTFLPCASKLCLHLSLVLLL